MELENIDCPQFVDFTSIRTFDINDGADFCFDRGVVGEMDVIITETTVIRDCQALQETINILTHAYKEQLNPPQEQKSSPIKPIRKSTNKENNKENQQSNPVSKNSNNPKRSLKTIQSANEPQIKKQTEKKPALTLVLAPPVPKPSKIPIRKQAPASTSKPATLIKPVQPKNIIVSKPVPEKKTREVPQKQPPIRKTNLNSVSRLANDIKSLNIATNPMPAKKPITNLNKSKSCAELYTNNTIYLPNRSNLLTSTIINDTINIESKDQNIKTPKTHLYMGIKFIPKKGQNFNLNPNKRFMPSLDVISSGKSVKNMKPMMANKPPKPVTKETSKPKTKVVVTNHKKPVDRPGTSSFKPLKVAHSISESNLNRLCQPKRIVEKKPAGLLHTELRALKRQELDIKTSKEKVIIPKPVSQQRKPQFNYLPTKDVRKF